MKYAVKPIIAMLVLASFICNIFAVEMPVPVRSQTLINDTDILAEFDGGTITRSDLLSKINQLQPQQQGRFKTTEGQLQVLDIITAEELFMKKALELGFDQLPEVKERVLAAEKQFYVQEYYRRNVTDLTMITDEMKAEFYEQNRQLYFVLPYITIDYLQAASEELANQAIARLRAGESFSAVSDELNLNSYARGLQGRIRNIRLNGNIPGVGNDPALEELIRNATASETAYVGPQQTVSGWSIFRKVEEIPGAQRSFEDVYEELEQRMRPKVERENLNNLMTRLKDKYAVTVDSLSLSRINLRIPDESIPYTNDLVIRSNNDEISMTVGEIISAFTKISPQEQLFYVRGEGASQLVEQELSKSLLYVEAKAQNYKRFFADNAEYVQMSRFHILTNTFRILVREAAIVSSEDAQAYYQANLETYTTPANRSIQVLWFNDMDVANRTWSLFNLANRTRSEARMHSLIQQFSTQPERNLLENQYNNGTVTGVGPDSEFSRLIWDTEIGALSPVFTTATGEIVFFKVLRENPPTYTPFTEVEPRIQGVLKQQKERSKQDEVIQQLSVEYNLRKYPERITLLLSADDLFELANTAAQQRNYNDAITYYDQIIAGYKNNQDDYKASFMKAFLISEEMNNKPRALELFRSFMTGFPEGDLHESAQFMIDVIEGRVNPEFDMGDLED